MTNKVTLVFNNHVNQEFDADISRYVRFASVEAGTQSEFAVDLPIDRNHAIALYRITQGQHIVPCDELKSHDDVYMLLRFAEWAGVPQSEVVSAMEGWTQHPNWMSLRAPEYMYPVWSRCESLVDYATWFRTAVDPYEVVSATVETAPSFDHEMTVNALQFYTDFNIAAIFDEGDDTTRERLAILRDARRVALDASLINPYTMTKYFVRTATDVDKWSCEGITSHPQPDIGKPTIADRDALNANFRSFTCGLLDASPNPECRGQAFPWKNVAACGGGALQILNQRYTPKRSSDLDLFIYGKSYEEKATAFQAVMKWFHSDKTVYALIGSVMSIYVIDIDRKFQIVNTNNKSIYEVIGRFDLSHIQHAIRVENGKLQVYSTPAACIAMREYVTRFVCTDRIRTDRIIKALYMGWDVCKDKRVMEEIVDITPIVVPPNTPALRRELLQLHQCFHPKSDMDPMFIEGMILQDSKATFVTRDVNFAINNIVLNGNFTTDYEAMLYTNFNDGALIDRNPGRRHFRTALKNRSGAIRLMSGELRVTGVIHGDDKTEIVCESMDPLFIEHINRLERVTYRQFSNSPVTKHIVDQHGKMQLFIDRVRMDMQTSRGTTILKAKKGNNLNLEEDLYEADTVQIIYTMVAESSGDVRFMRLVPLRIIKNNEHVSRDDNEVEDNNREQLEGKIADMAINVVDDICIDVPANLAVKQEVKKPVAKKLVTKKPAVKKPAPKLEISDGSDDDVPRAKPAARRPVAKPAIVRETSDGESD